MNKKASKRNKRIKRRERMEQVANNINACADDVTKMLEKANES